jgi:hypothetical protein
LCCLNLPSFGAPRKNDGTVIPLLPASNYTPGLECFTLSAKLKSPPSGYSPNADCFRLSAKLKSPPLGYLPSADCFR